MIFLHRLVVFSSPQSIATSEHPDNIKIKQSKTRGFQCFECDRPDPLKADKATGWLKGELQPPK
jgi:hypothetical protein